MMEQNSKEKKTLENILFKPYWVNKTHYVESNLFTKYINFIHLTELWTCQVEPLHPKPGSMIYVQISFALLMKYLIKLGDK